MQPAPERVGLPAVWRLARGATDRVVHQVRGEPVGHEHAEQAAMIERVAIEIGGAFPRNDRLERRRIEVGDPPLVHRVIGNTVEADLAIAPRLRRRPFDGVIEVDRFRGGPGFMLAGRLAAAARIDAHAGIALRHPPQRVDRLPVHVFVALFLEVRWRHPELVLLVWAEVEDRRHFFCALRTEDVGHQFGAVAHRHFDILMDHHGIGGDISVHVHSCYSLVRCCMKRDPVWRQRSSHVGSRFSMKAQIPSLASRAIMFSVMTSEA